MLLIVIVALLVQLSLQTTRLQQSRVREEQLRADHARMVAEAALQKFSAQAQAQALQAKQPAAGPLPQTNSGAAPKQPK